MPAKKPRLYLFHGSDSQASRRAVRNWQEKFQAKYGDHTRYLVRADEESESEFVRFLTTSLLAQTLLADAKLAVVSRVTASEKGKSAPHTKALLTFLKDYFQAIGPETTVVIWEDRRLDEGHPLRRWFAEHEEKGLAKIYGYDTPNDQELLRRATAYVEEAGGTLLPDARQWLVTHLRRLEKEQRLAQRLRSMQVLVEDERPWWLTNILQAALAVSGGGALSAALLDTVQGVTAQPVSVFEIVNAVRSRQWKQARVLLRHWEGDAVDEGGYFALYSLLRTEFRKTGNQTGLVLLADVELLVKNFPLPHAWLTELLLMRLEHPQENPTLLPPRTLWKAHLLRT